MRAWLCDAPTPQGACGKCASCHGIDVHTHPDLVVLMPETDMIARGWPLPEKAQSDIDDKKRKPSKEIRVDAMRDAIEFAQRTSGRGRGKAVLVYPAERMNQVTANALLKTLEEPPGDVRFVLATDAAHLLLPTIRSRCLGHTLLWPDADEALPWLSAQGIAAGRAPPCCAPAAGGRPKPWRWRRARTARAAGHCCHGHWRRARPARWPICHCPKPWHGCRSCATTCWRCRWVPRRASSTAPICPSGRCPWARSPSGGSSWRSRHAPPNIP
ncbi:hypothetical protein H0I39_20980 [Ottowia beijingensis]|uniref:DNA polymerase III subunit delta n=1 Tax=Ottowia beijingensis TaxID=1207057 RepID=A0A853IZY9_9BURK|nr:hypothetical protein [Ottowia beijingensis]